MLLVSAARARAQCPNGRPPPCGAAKSATPAASERRANPALNPRAWIVVPFSNVTRAPDVDWLRDASVNLLSLDMGRWTDVSVVPDKRVADLVRELPPNRRAEALSLNDGLGIARRAGAGMLVMGDFFKLGSGARIVANVFDARTGAKLRTFTEEVPAADSLLTAFGPLARGVLAVPPPADAKTGDVGTTSLDAYQAYLLGAKALFRDDMPEARAQLLRALSIDSTFALAHLRYSMLLWGSDATGGAGESRRHALAAQRLGVSLPKRDRTLIDAQLAVSSADYSRACEIIKPLVARDSSDVEALFLLGECSFYDATVDPILPDSMVGTFRNSLNTAVRALTRVLELDPSHLNAFEHVFDILQLVQRGGLTCPTPGARPENCLAWSSMVLRSGDSLVTVPVRYGLNVEAFLAQQDKARREKPRVANLELAQELAQRWLDADRTSEGARIAMARVRMARGDVLGAAAVARGLSARAEPENYEALRLMMDIAVKRGQGAVARAMFDSLVKAIPDTPVIDAQRGAIELVFGRMKRFDRGGTRVAERFGPEAVAYQHQVRLAVLGVPQQEMVRAESVYYAAMGNSPCNLPCRLTRLSPTLAYSLHVPTLPRAFLDSASRMDTRIWLAGALARGDTADLRSAARNMEQGARGNVAQELGEFGWSLIAAQGYLALHDSAAAMRMVRFYVDTAMLFTPVGGPGAPGIVPAGASGFWTRAMLLRADLAKAMGLKAEARGWYLRVLDLWADADPELQPTLERVRAALAALDTKA